MSKCLICREREANKTNSHLLPAFLEAVVGSYDRSYKRDREILIKKTWNEAKIYVGKLPSTEYDRLFDQEKLTEERIQNELSDNPCSLDYVFCSECETALSRKLEAPYGNALHSRKNVNPIVALFFWLSVVWRMAIEQTFGFRLPDEIKERLVRCLNDFLWNDLDEDQSLMLAVSAKFSYRLFACRDYCRDEEHGGYIYGKLSGSGKSLIVVVGDYALEIYFDEECLSEAPPFFLNRDLVNSAPVNDGSGEEICVDVSVEDWNKMYHRGVSFMAQLTFMGHIKYLNRLWMSMYIGLMPMELAMRILRKMYESNEKMGEKFTKERWLSTLKEFLLFPTLNINW